ncbi:Protein wwc3 [Saguinus oedipus]|uniref:Protein wwc3 n=1 Tax=Saguinus oedipus TaxID=9490 RepID=A0ABQ9TEK2_SAGOE|nr:Protein wwc3 [Saguinus oedipus]
MPHGFWVPALFFQICDELIDLHYNLIKPSLSMRELLQILHQLVAYGMKLVAFPPVFRNEDAEEPAYADTASNGDPQIHVGLLCDSSSECLLVHVLQLKNPAGLAVKEDCKVHIRVYLPPLDSGTPSTYCSKALEFQVPLVFNEVFRIPVHSSALTLKSLQLYVCSVTQQLQEELLGSLAGNTNGGDPNSDLIKRLGIAQINLADYDSLTEMQLRWHSVQVFTSSEPPRTREPGCVGESSAREPTRIVSVSGKTDAVTVLLARTTAQLQAVERELAEERAKLEYTEEEVLEMERKEEQTEAVSER